MSDLLREELALARGLADRVCNSRAVRLYDDNLYDHAESVRSILDAALAAAAPPPDQKDLLGGQGGRGPAPRCNCKVAPGLAAFHADDCPMMAPVPPAAPQPATLTPTQAAEIRGYLQGKKVPHPSNISDLLDALRAIEGAAPQTPAEPVAYILDPGAGSASDRLVWARDVNCATEASRYKERGGSLTPLYASPHSAGPAADSVAPTLSGSGES